MTITEVVQITYKKLEPETKRVVGNCLKNQTCPWYKPLVNKIHLETSIKKKRVEKRVVNTFLDTYTYLKQKEFSYKKIEGYKESDADIEAFIAFIHTAKKYLQ